MSETYKVVIQIGGREPNHGRLCLTRIMESPNIMEILKVAEILYHSIVSVVPTGDEPELCLHQDMKAPLDDSLVKLWLNGRPKPVKEEADLECFEVAARTGSQDFVCRDNQVLFAALGDFRRLPNNHGKVNALAAAVCDVFWRRVWQEREMVNDMAACELAEKHMAGARAFGDKYERA